MGEMKVEHVLLFLVGAFLVYHMMGKCGKGFNEGFQNCQGTALNYNRQAGGSEKCEDVRLTQGDCENHYSLKLPSHYDGKEEFIQCKKNPVKRGEPMCISGEKCNAKN